jgi:hypothetical protein
VTLSLALLAYQSLVDLPGKDLAEPTLRAQGKTFPVPADRPRKVVFLTLRNQAAKATPSERHESLALSLMTTSRRLSDAPSGLVQQTDLSDVFTP